MGVSSRPPPHAQPWKHHSVDRKRVRVQHCESRGSREAVGSAQEQAAHDLREDVSLAPLLLQSGHSGQGGRQAIHVQVRLRHSEVHHRQQEDQPLHPDLLTFELCDLHLGPNHDLMN